jgi:anti-anti-sigma factor
MFTPVGEITVVRVFGDIDLSTVHVLQAALGEARHRRPSHLVVDVAGMGFCSVLGLAELANAGPEPAGHRAEYLLSGVRPHLERHLGLLWPADTLPVRYPSVGAAVLTAMAHQHDRRDRARPIRHAVGHPTRTGLRRVTDSDRVRPTSDDELTECARDGDREAYREMAHRHRARMYRSALQMLGSPEEDDNAHDVAVQLRRALAAFGEGTLL